MKRCNTLFSFGRHVSGGSRSPVRRQARLVLVAGLLLVTVFAPSTSQSSPEESHATPGLALPSGDGSFLPASPGNPLAFTENVGQFDSQVAFLVRGGDQTLFLTGDALWISLMEPQPPSDTGLGAGGGAPTGPAKQPGRRANLKLSFVGANARPRLEPFDRQAAWVSFFLGGDPADWHPDVPTWGGVRYVDLYPGLDLELTTEGGHLAPRLVVRQLSSLADVRLRVEGAEKLTLEGDYLRLATSLGDVILPLLILEGATQAGEPTIWLADGAYSLTTPFAATSLQAGNGGPASTSPLQYSTYLGGSCEDRAYDIAVDSEGNVYVTGQVASVDFPTTPGAYDPDNNDDPPGCEINDWTGEVFVTKLSADGSTLLYSTYLGGNSEDAGYGIAVDAGGSVYLAGKTYSTDFPTSPGALDSTLSGGRDAFMAKLNPAGDDLVYSTYLGGSSWEYGLDIAVDGQGYAYVTGFTHGGFPTTPETFQPGGGGAIDPFVAKLNLDGSALVYSTYLGGSWNDGGDSLAVDSVGNVYVTGGTGSPDFPTANALQPDKAGGDADAFVAKLNAEGSDLIYSTYLGGSTAGSGESGYGIVIDHAGNAYVTGATNATDFPTVDPLQPAYGGGTLDGFLAKLNADGSALLFSTYYGGSSLDRALGIGIDRAGHAYITGYTSSTDLPTVDPLQAANAGGYDAFLAKIRYDGGALLYSTYVGGSEDENCYNPGQGDAGLAVHPSGKAYLTGLTSSTDFPITEATWDTSFNGGASDAFVTSLYLFHAGGRIFLPLLMKR